MGILSDRQIETESIVTPCEPCATRPGKVSYGLSSYGYDARIGYRFRVFKTYPCTVIDPKAFDERMFEVVDLRAASAPDHILIPPHAFALGETVETFIIPRDVLAVVVGKSTYARCGLIVNVTPLEPEWRGKITVELSNTTPLPIKVYCGEGIMQVLFLRSDGHDCAVSYADKKGRYQDQTGVTAPFVEPAAVCELCDGRGSNRAGQACIECSAAGTAPWDKFK